MAADHPPSADDLHDAVGDRLRAAGQRYTPARRQLVQLLADASSPMTVPDLMASEAAVAMSSAYRNITVLEQVGVIERIAAGEHARFELTEDIIGDHHHHLICSSCGRVEDFTVSAGVERSLEKALAKVVENSTFTPTSHRLDLIGTCGDCTRR